MGPEEQISRASAKLNLYLEVVGKRPDGYHDLRTLFQTVDLADDVIVERRDEAGVTCFVEGGELPSDERNLAVRAAHAWLRATHAPGGASIRLTKRIPIGGGLGGGSADAAAVLSSLQVLGDARHRLSNAALVDVARALGADVPFLIEGGLAAATGRGDVITTLPTPPTVTYVLIFAPFGTDTGKVYAHAHERLRQPPRDGLAAAIAAVQSGDAARIREAHHNDLAQPAMRAYPELLRFTSATERLLGRAPSMTGSGSTLFDVPDRGEVDDVVARLTSLPGRRVVVEGHPRPTARL